ncbi:uncharacterized protein EDB91DRAFT_1246017 [Suillus paluster]|uniref:uncharacterized protein n=1 Tax=Suillus paluster TaxID=48578 RepID=UPI001B868B8E|nr:uncharacterized protein EDB91DRAFT_1246017 [Suillus paluster]KAG1745877.1 hypothetical protein EDB91DRAFT_1246017 [Suillus paluster]
MTKKQAVRAKEWQVDILKNMHAEEPRPSASQRRRLAVETGLDEVWIRNWFIRYNKRSGSRPLGGSTPTRRGGSLMHTIKLIVPRSDTTIHSDTSRSQGPSPAHPVLSPGTSDILPPLDTLLASVNGQAVKYYSRRMLHPSYTQVLPQSVDPRFLGYIPGAPSALGSRSSSSSSSSCYSSLGEENAFPRNTRKWRYSRDPLHNRYPDFSAFFLPTPCDAICDAAGMPEFSPIATSSPMHSPSSLSTVLSPDFTLSTMPMHSPIALPVSFPARLSFLHAMQAEEALDFARDSLSPSH